MLTQAVCSLCLMLPFGPDDASSYATEIYELINRQAAALANPPSDAHEHGAIADAFHDALGFACDFPHPALRPALNALLKHQEPGFVSGAAYAILQFNDTDGFEALKPLVSDEREIVAGHWAFQLGPCIQSYFDERSKPVTITLESAEPFYWSSVSRTEVKTTGIISVPIALELMRGRDPAARLAAFYWLARGGFVFEVAPLEEAWLGAGDVERVKLIYGLSNSGKYLGRERLRVGMEKLVSQLDPRRMSDDQLAAVARVLGSIGSRSALRFALPVVDRYFSTDFALRTPDEPIDPGQRALVESLEAVAAVAVVDDIGMALMWTFSPNWVIRRGALAVMSRLDHPAATACVNEFLRTEITLDTFDAPSVLEALGARERCDNGVCWTYVMTVNERMQRDASVIAATGVRSYCTAQLDYLIGTLEHLTGVSNGFGGFPSPGWDAKQAIETAHRWDEWVHAQNASRIPDTFGGNAQPLDRR